MGGVNCDPVLQQFVGGMLTPWLRTWWQLSCRIFVSRINTAIEAIKPVLISFEAFCFYLYPRYFKPTSTDSWNAIKKIFLFLFNDDFAPSFLPTNEFHPSFSCFFFITDTKIRFDSTRILVTDTNLRFNNEITFAFMISLLLYLDQVFDVYGSNHQG